jgi:adenylate cyclase
VKWWATSRLRTKIFVAIAALVLGLLLATLWLVEQAVSRQAERSLTHELMVTGEVFQQLLAEREERLMSNSILLTGDFALKRALATYDPATLATVAVNYRERSGVDLLWILDEQGQMLADAAGREPAGSKAADRPAIAAARETGKPAAAIAAVGDGLVQLVAVPVLGPEMIGLLVLGTAIDDATARDLETRTGSSVTFLTADRLFASSWDPATRGRLVLPASGGGVPYLTKLPSGRHLSLLVPVAASLASPLHALVQRSWDEALAPLRSLRRRMTLIGFGALLVALGVGVAIAHGVTAPIVKLVTATREVLRGNLEHRVAVARQDEIGVLATSFNEMTGGLEERARIRAMIDKVVSPEVAHELLARGLTLGGELREVTVLFADLRDSTAIGERLTPTALLELLNAFLSRMAHAIEQERGIVDKYVGDEIMAVFGAPLDLPDHAERAVAAAVGMMEALADLNAERAPAAPLRMGIGIATGTVIAGNVGSAERMNYTVLGDVVNLAARLQGMTKEHEVGIEATQSALPARFATRGLGTVTVRGRAAPTALYTLDRPRSSRPCEGG